MSTIKIILITCTQLISLLVIAFAGPILDVVQLIAGSVTVDDFGRWSYRIAYLYFPLSGLLFTTGVVCLIMGADGHNNQLVLTGKEFGFKVLKLWMIQNVLVALLCIHAYMTSIAYLDGRLEHLRNQTSESRSAPSDNTKAISSSIRSAVSALGR